MNIYLELDCVTVSPSCGEMKSCIPENVYQIRHIHTRTLIVLDTFNIVAALFLIIRDYIKFMLLSFEYICYLTTAIARGEAVVIKVCDICGMYVSLFQTKNPSFLLQSFQIPQWQSE